LSTYHLAQEHKLLFLRESKKILQIIFEVNKMPKEREDIVKLSLCQTPSNFARALKLRESGKGGSPLNTEELEALLNDLRPVYKQAHDDVEARGSVLTVTKYTAKGKPYTTEMINPMFHTMMKLGSRIAHIVVLLSKQPSTSNAAPGSAADLFPDLFEEGKVQ
jgi:hypothetical protein